MMDRSFSVLPLLLVTVLWGGWFYCPTDADHQDVQLLLSGTKMVTKQLSHIPVLLVLGQVFYGAATQQCTEAEYSKYGMMLRGHIFKKITGVSLSGLCLLDCYQDVRCQSFNYVISKHMCELNNRTKEARPEDYVPDPDRLYFRRDMNRVPLGSIPELPAETCKEIKASEGGQAVSAKYWFDSIIPGETVFAHCDMKTEDIDECAAPVDPCDAVPNSSCNNTIGSYICKCKDGFVKNGSLCGVSAVITQKPSSVVFEEGYNLSLVCQATGYPKPTVTWRRAYSHLPKGKTIVSEGTLTIRNITKQMVGLTHAGQRISLERILLLHK
ncbi:uncharacterized protein LOC144633062 [Oculina patagonica]